MPLHEVSPVLHTQAPAEHMRLVPQDMPSVAFPRAQKPVVVLQVFTLHAVVDGVQPVVTQLWTHTPLVPGLEQTKPATQSALLAQLVLQVVPVEGQMKLPEQECGGLNLQVPAPQVPAS